MRRAQPSLLQSPETPSLLWALMYHSWDHKCFLFLRNLFSQTIYMQELKPKRPLAFYKMWKSSLKTILMCFIARIRHSRQILICYWRIWEWRIISTDELERGSWCLGSSFFFFFLHDIPIHTWQTLPALMLHWNRGTGKISTAKKRKCAVKDTESWKYGRNKNRKGKLRINRNWLPLWMNKNQKQTTQKTPTPNQNTKKYLTKTVSFWKCNTYCARDTPVQAAPAAYFPCFPLLFRALSTAPKLVRFMPTHDSPQHPLHGNHCFTDLQRIKQN